MVEWSHEQTKYKKINAMIQDQREEGKRNLLRFNWEREKGFGFGHTMMDKENEREIELESAMYTNCLLIGLDPAIIGMGASNWTPPVGHFRHSNSRLGEQLLYFLLSSLRGPIQSAQVIHPFYYSLQLCKFRTRPKTCNICVSVCEFDGQMRF